MKAYIRKIKKGEDITLHTLEHEIDRMTLAAVLGGTRWHGPSISTLLETRQAQWVASNIPFSKVIGHGILQTFPEKFKCCFTNFSKSLFSVKQEVAAYEVKGKLGEKKFAGKLLQCYKTLINNIEGKKFRVCSTVTLRQFRNQPFYLRYIVKRRSGKIYCGLSRFKDDSDPKAEFVSPMGNALYIESEDVMSWFRPPDLMYERFHVHACFYDGEYKCKTRIIKGCPEHRLKTCSCNPMLFKNIKCWIHARTNKWYVDFHYRGGRIDRN